MKHFLVGLAVGAGLALSGVAVAGRMGLVSGNLLYDYETSGSLSDGASALGYSVGVFDTYVLFQAGRREGLTGLREFCAPEGVNGQQVHDIVVKFMREHPEHRAELGATIVMTSLSRAFPCLEDGAQQQ